MFGKTEKYENDVSKERFKELTDSKPFCFALICLFCFYFSAMPSFSFWDFLPSEIQDYILHLAKVQSTLEVAWRNGHSCSLYRGPRNVKAKWGLGPVFVTGCPRQQIYGSHYDMELGIYTAAYLGSSEDEALSRMNHVKSFI